MMIDPGWVQSTVNESQANEMSLLLLVCIDTSLFSVNRGKS